MANPEHLALLKGELKKWNEWRNRNPQVIPDLSRARLGNMELNTFDLRGANLSDAILHDTNLIEADLSEANLCDANLRGANLRWADMRGAALRGAVLVEANLAGAVLYRADFRWVLASGTHFVDVDLSAVVGLKQVVHEGPSFVDVETIYQSRGEIPELFLRGCGVPDDMIGYIKSIAGAIQFYSCFISYSTKDQEFADRLYADLQNKGVRCWFAPHDIHGGRKIHEQLDEAIRVHDKLLLILSDDSMNSNWVKTEIAKARRREEEENRVKDPLNRKERLNGAPEDDKDGAPTSIPTPRPKKRMLFPITLVPYEAVREWECFDGDTGIDSARDHPNQRKAALVGDPGKTIREYFIPDFSNWKDHDSYKDALDRLVRDLKAGT